MTARWNILSGAVRPLLVSFSLWVVVAPLGAQESGGPEMSHVLRPVTDPTTIQIDLGRADVRVRRGAPDALRIRLRTLSGRGDTIRPPRELATVEEAGGVVRIVSTPTGRREAGVGVSIEVPGEVVLRVHLERGDIRAEGVSGRLELSTSRGDVRLNRIAGSVLVDLKDGNVEASFRSLDPELPSAFATLNGNVDLELPADAALDLDVRCRGCTPDAPGMGGMERRRILGPPEEDPILALHGPIGGGGPALRIFTWNGEVTVRRP